MAAAAVMLLICLAAAPSSGRVGGPEAPAPLEQLSVGDRSGLPDQCAKSIFNSWRAISRNALALLGDLTIQPGRLYFSELGWFNYEVQHSPEGKPYFYVDPPLVLSGSAGGPVRYLSLYYPTREPSYPLTCAAELVQCEDEVNMLRRLSGARRYYCDGSTYINLGSSTGR